MKTTRRPTEQAYRPLVLIADDALDAREMYAAYLEHEGFRVLLAVDGVEAVDVAFSAGPDAIVMDLAMPGLNGLDATRKLKADARTRHIPVICVTGHASPDTERAVRAAGGDAYFTKPCLPDVIVAALRRELE